MNMARKNGMAQIPLLLVLLILAISLPMLTKLVQKNTENRSKAACTERCADNQYWNGSYWVIEGDGDGDGTCKVEQCNWVGRPAKCGGKWYCCPASGEKWNSTVTEECQSQIATPTPTTVQPTATPTTAQPTATPTTVIPTATPTTVRPTATPTRVQPTGITSECEDDSDCSRMGSKTYFACIGGFCVTKGCSSQSDCPEGYYCYNLPNGGVQLAIPPFCRLIETTPTIDILNFVISYPGVLTEAKCANNWSITVTVLASDGAKKTFNDVIPEKMGGSTSGGLAKYQASVDLSGFNWTSGLAVFVKGSKHLQTKYGENSQTSFYGKSGGTLTFTENKVFDFTGYPVLAGDVNQDNVVDGLDFSLVKTASITRKTVASGGNIVEDLNGNCAMESQDLGLLMITLNQKQDQLY